MKDKHKKEKAEKEREAAPESEIQLGGDLPAPTPDDEKALRVGKDCDYERELRRLQVELVKLQEWIRHEKMRVVVIFEGRDAAGKGGAIKRITESLNPRVCRIVALGTPTERETTNGTSRDMFPTCRRPARWCSSIVVGTTAPGSSG